MLSMLEISPPAHLLDVEAVWEADEVAVSGNENKAPVCHNPNCQAAR
jgi:hypothetical protein